jgi:hypothetical protein
VEEKCTKCHVVVRPADYFCFNCGNNLKPVPPSLLPVDQIWLYTKSILIPPFGVLWAYRYLKENNNKSKIVGMIAVILTLISLVVSSILFKNFVNDVNTQVSKQMDSFSF